MDITEQKLYEAFKLTPPEETGAGEQGQETADPAQGSSEQDVQTGEQAQEAADPAREESEGEQEEQNPQEESTESSEGTALSKEQRRQNAARRRQQEQKQAVDSAVAQALKAQKEQTDGQLKTFFASMGMKNTFTGQPITTLEEANDWKEKFDAEKFNEDLKKGRLTTEQLSQIIESHPAVRQAQEVLQQTQQERQQERTQQEQARIDAEIAEISKISKQLGGEPVEGIGDLLAMEKSEEFRAYVQRGYSFLDSYKLTHMEEMTNAKAAAAKQQALNLSRGKDHLRSAGAASGAGTVSVPASEMRMYRAFNPDATDAQIQAHYNKYKKQ